MKKIINIGEKVVAFKATASTPLRYREKFGEDVFRDISKLVAAGNGALGSGELEIFLRIAYIMAKQADDSIPDDPEEWLDQFDIMPILEILPELMELWGLNVQTIEKPKKKVNRQSAN